MASRRVVLAVLSVAMPTLAISGTDSESPDPADARQVAPPHELTAAPPRQIAGEIVVRLATGTDRHAVARCAGLGKTTFEGVVPDRSTVGASSPRSRRAPTVLAPVVYAASSGRVDEVDRFPNRRTHRAAVTRDDLRRWHRLRYRGDRPPAEVAADVARCAGVERAEPNHVVRLASVPDDTYAGDGGGTWVSGAWGQSHADSWALERIGAADAWAVHTGSGDGIVVALVDSGLDIAHPDIAANVWVNPGEIAGNGIDDDGNGYEDDVHGWSFAYGIADVTDRFWHGTHMAGVIAARGNNGIGIAGVLWDARVQVVKSFDDFGNGTSSAIASGITYAADNGADVINLSFSFRGDASEIVRDAVRYAHAQGAVVVAAAGNSNADTRDCNSGFAPGLAVSYPSCFAESIGVASVDRFDAKTDSSNFGAAIDVAAPGGDSADGSKDEDFKNILSLRSQFPALERHLQVDNEYFRNRGTSLSAAYTAGLAGLLLSHRPSLGNELVRAILQSSADDVGAIGVDGTFGHGLVRADVALAQADAALALPELTILSATASRRVAPAGGVALVTIEATNAGAVAADDVVVELFDGDPDAGGASVARWTLARLDANTTRALDGVVPLGEEGERSLVATIATSASSEFYLENNRREIAIDVFPYRFVETRLTAVVGEQDRPDIDGDRVVWHDHRDDPIRGNIYLFDLATGTERQLTSSPGYEERPAIDGDIVSWHDLRDQDPPPGTWDIWRYDLATDTEHRVSFVQACGERYCAETIADASDGAIVWMDARNGLGNTDIYLYDVALDVERRITTAGGNQEDPEIDGDLVVYEDWRGTNPDIYLYDLATDQETPICTDPAHQWVPEVKDGLVVWEDDRHGDTEIYVHDLAEGTERRLTDAPGDRANPVVSGRFVIWQDRRNENQWDIWAHDLVRDEQRRVTLDRGTQRRPSIDGRRIVWQDWRHSGTPAGMSGEIYLGTIDDFPGAPTGVIAQEGTDRVSLGWNPAVDPEGDAVTYVVYRAVGDGPWAVIGTAATEMFEDLAPVPGAVHRYRVAALDEALGNADGVEGEGPWSDAASVTPGSSAGVGAVPDGFRHPGPPLGIAKSGSNLTLTWAEACAPTGADYGVYEGELGRFDSHAPRTCSTGGATSWSLAPGSGDRYFLVAPHDGARDGSFGADSAGAERGAAVPCHTPLAAPCP